MSPSYAGRPRAPEDPATDLAVARAVTAFRQGCDREASFRLLVERFHRPVLSYFARRVASPEDRHDLTQEVFLQAFRGLDDFRGDSRFSTWLFRIAHHTWLGWVRQRTRAREEPLDEQQGHLGLTPATSGAPVTADTDLLARERRRRLRAAIDELPDQMRRCMALRVVHELSYREIADTLRISMGTVKAHLFKGRERLADDLREELDDLGG